MVGELIDNICNMKIIQYEVTSTDKKNLCPNLDSNRNQYSIKNMELVLSLSGDKISISK